MDEQTHTDSELEIDTATDEAADTAATDTNDQESESESEQERDTLDLGATPKTESKAEAARNKLVDSAVMKIKNGALTIDSLPKDQQWLKPYVEAKLGTSAKEPELDIDSRVDAALTKKENENRLKSLVGELNENLSLAKRKELKEQSDFFRSKGLSPLDALETAMAKLNIDLEEDRIDARRQAARLRTPGRYKAPGKNATPEAIHMGEGYAEVRKNFTPEQRLEYLKGLKGIRR